MKKAVLQVEAKLHGNGYERKDWHLVDLENFTAGYCQQILHGFFTFYQVKSFFQLFTMLWSLDSWLQVSIKETFFVLRALFSSHIDLTL